MSSHEEDRCESDHARMILLSRAYRGPNVLYDVDWEPGDGSPPDPGRTAGLPHDAGQLLDLIAEVVEGCLRRPDAQFAAGPDPLRLRLNSIAADFVSAFEGLFYEVNMYDALYWLSLRSDVKWMLANPAPPAAQDVTDPHEEIEG